MDTVCAFATNLVSLREMQGLSRYGLAKRAGVSWQVLQRLEKATQAPDCLTVLVAVRLAYALDTTVEDLIGRYLSVDGCHTLR